jgi:hypothetical protein
MSGMAVMAFTSSLPRYNLGCSNLGLNPPGLVRLLEQGLTAFVTWTRRGLKIEI